MRECGLKLLSHTNLFLVEESLPMRECGLKLLLPAYFRRSQGVTPHAGVWIETLTTLDVGIAGFSHSPCGSVD